MCDHTHLKGRETNGRRITIKKSPSSPPPSPANQSRLCPSFFPPLFLLCLYPWVISVSQTKAKNTKEEGGRAVACWIHYSTLSAICSFRLFDRPLNHCCKKRTAGFLPDFSSKKLKGKNRSPVLPPPPSFD